MESQPQAESTAQAAESIPAESSTAAEGNSERPLLRLHAGVYFGGMIVCGGVFMVVAMLIFPIYIPPSELLVPMPPPEIAIAREESLARCRMANSAIAMGILSFTIAAVFGFGEAAVRQFGRGSGLRLAPAIVLGAAGGCAGALLAHFIAEQTNAMKLDMALTRTVLSQVALLGVASAGIAAAIGLVAQGVRGGMKLSLFGLTSGLLAGALFPIAASFLLPKSQTELIIPGGVLWGAKDLPVLALWVGAIVVSLAIILPIANSQTTKKSTGKKRDSAATAAG